MFGWRILKRLYELEQLYIIIQHLIINLHETIVDINMSSIKVLKLGDERQSDLYIR